jgi:hypothetical protein
MEPLFHFALALLSAGGALAGRGHRCCHCPGHRGTGQAESQHRGPFRQAGALMSFQRDSYTRQARSGKVSGHMPRSHSDAGSFMFLNYAALLQKGAPGANQAKSNSGCTSTLMKFLETLAARPLSLSVIILSIGITALCVGFAVHIAGPVSIHIPHVELPAVEIHAGSAPVVAEPNNNVVPSRRRSPRRHPTK